MWASPSAACNRSCSITGEVQGRNVVAAPKVLCSCREIKSSKHWGHLCLLHNPTTDFYIFLLSIVHHSQMFIMFSFLLQVPSAIDSVRPQPCFLYSYSRVQTATCPPTLTHPPPCVHLSLMDWTPHDVSWSHHRNFWMDGLNSGRSPPSLPVSPSLPWWRF